MASHKRILAARLRMYGYEYDEIARRCGYSSASEAYDSVLIAVKGLPQESIEALKQLELTRLNLLQKVAWKRLHMLSSPSNLRRVGGSRRQDALDPIPIILKIMERRAKLEGLDAPERHNILISEAERIAEATGKPVEAVLEMAQKIAAEQWAR